MSRGGVVVTGAAGFIGSHLCERLVADGRRVIGVDAFRPTYPRAWKERNLAALAGEPRFTLLEADIGGGGLRLALRAASAVVHLAGRAGARDADPAPFERDNVAATRALLAACRRAGVRRFVLGSSSSIYGTVTGPVGEDQPPAPASPYARSKLAAELLCGTSGLDVVTLRYFTVYGPRQRPDMAFARFIAAALGAGPAPLLGDGGQVRDFTFVNDAVEATVRALASGRPGATYNVAGGRPATLTGALELIAAALGRPIAVRGEPPSALDPRRTEADLRRAARDLGWAPTVSLTDGMAAQVAAALGADPAVEAVS